MSNFLKSLLFSALIIPVGINAQSSADHKIIQCSAEKFTEMIQGNVTSLSNLLHSNLRYVHSNGWVETKEDVLENIRSGKLVYHSIEILETEVRSGDGFAVLIGRGIFSVSLEGKPMELELKFTEVYVYDRKVKQWLLYSRHANRMPEIN
jgi:hypothetical protein